MTQLSTRFCALLLACFAVLLAGRAQAQMDDELIPATRRFVSPEHVVLELRGGPYHPGSTGTGTQAFSGAFDDVYGSSTGPLLDLEIGVIAYRLPNILYLTADGSVGRVSYSGSAFDANLGGLVGEKSTFTMVPLAALGALRIDALPRKLHLPLILTGKLGWEWAYWQTSTGTRSDASGWSVGPAYGGQLALDLDTFEPTAARMMDEEWGINHTFIFFEIYAFSPLRKSLPVGTTTWALGLGFVF